MSVVRLAVLLCAGLIALTGCGAAPSVSDPVFHRSSTATSARDFGGMAGLVVAAKKEGVLNLIAVPRDWANYGAIIDGFTAEYGIKVNDENPDGSSQAEISAINTRKGQDRAPDVVDLGGSFAPAAAQTGLFAPYRVAIWDDIPANQKDPKARWYNDYGGYVSIGCDDKRVTTCPTTFAQLTDPQYRGQIALNGNPTSSGAAYAGVYAAALANHGSFANIGPGLEFFGRLKRIGNFNPVESTPATVESGETPISIDWDYLNAGYADEFRSKGVDWKVAVPTDATFAQYYSQAVNSYAPHPAAARLWEEYLYSTAGQNLFLKGFARPAEMPAMRLAGTLDEPAAAKLPPVTGTPNFPTDAEQANAKQVLAQGWGDAISD